MIHSWGTETEERQGKSAMAKVKLSVSKDGSTYIPESLRREGFVGDVEALPNAFTVTLIKPGTPLSRVKKSLQLIIKGIELRMEHEFEEGAAAREEAIAKEKAEKQSAHCYTDRCWIEGEWIDKADCPTCTPKQPKYSKTTGDNDG